MTDRTALLGDDVQARRPATHVSLSRVGVTGVEKVLRIRSNGSEQLFYAELECFVDLPAGQKGAHMSRFEEIVNEAIEKAHRHPRFVEDCVREMIRMAVERFRHLGDEAFVMARQENLETIHKHNVVAERYGVIGRLLREIEGDEHVTKHLTMREWLEAEPAA